MTGINGPEDAAGIRNLRLKNATSVAVTPATETRPGADSLETGNEKATVPPVVERKQRRKNDRRQNNRRQGKASVMLDTRSQHDRRKNDRRKSDVKKNRYGSRKTADNTNENSAATPGHKNRGIDEMV